MTTSAVETICLRALRGQRSTIIQHARPQRRCIAQTAPSRATALPITAAGPPPGPPEPSPSHYGSRVEQMRKKAALIQQGKDIRASQKQGNKTSPLRKRFWKDVHVKEVEAGYQIYLDTRPVRTPTKQILTVPKSKAHLAHAIAIEWDLLANAQQALKNHKIPMTSIVARAQDIIDAEAQGDIKSRQDILKTLMRYLSTDTLLCWAPITSQTALDMKKESEATTGQSLRDIQKETAEAIISYLTTTVWPGVEIIPVLDGDIIMPASQSDVTNSIISGWITGLPAFELAALERAVLASKSLLVGTRLLIEWSEEFRDVNGRAREPRFGIHEAALASTIEVRWQTGMWGEVEDTHDVENEDIRRQFGSAVLVVSGAR